MEMIQRIGCMGKDGARQEYQKGGCGRIGKGNISELFRSIEEYEKSVEAKHSAVALRIESGAGATDPVLCIMEQKKTMFFVISDA